MKNPSPKSYQDKFDPFIYPIKEKRKFESPQERINKDFLEVLISRRSTNDFMPLSEKEIAVLLYWSTKIQSIQIDETGFVLSKRITPSGGSRHPIDLLVSITNKTDNRTLAYYNPIDHSLASLELPAKRLLSFFNEISQNLPIQNACILWFSIQHAKTGSKYQNPESLYWKDTGALLYCIQLIATYLGYKSCPLGTLANDSFNNLFNSPELISGGGIIIGK